MPRFFPPATSKAGAILLVSAPLLLLAPLLLIRTCRVATATSAATIPQEAHGPAPDAPARDTPPQLESERIWIGPNGFEPAEITRPAGRVLLAVNDRSGLPGLVLRVAVEGRDQLFEVRVPQDTGGSHEWRRVVNLPAGRYVLTEANHPEWVCRVTITAR
jgi:hypothetical protein